MLRVREISNEEGNKLRRIVRHGREPIGMKRAQVVLASAQSFTPPKIALIAGMSEEYVRDLIHFFNEHGFALLKPRWGPGRPHGLSTHRTPDVRAYAKGHRIVLVPTATQASWMNPVECHAGDIQDLALAGADPQDPLEVSWAMDAAVAYRNEERRARGKTFRDTVRKDKRRRSKRPV